MTEIKTIEQLKQLQIWNYLGADMQNALEQKLATLDDAAKMQIATSLTGLEKTYQEVKSQANEETFVYLMQKALLNLADDLLREVDDVKKDYFKEKEQTERTEEVQAVEATLDSI